MKKIFVINLGTTSTKIAYYENENCIYKENLMHDADEIKQYNTVWDQFAMRKKAIDDFMALHDIKVHELDAFVSRGGHTEPLTSGVYKINKKMLEESASMKYGNHVSDLGLKLAYEYSKEGPLPFTVDTACTDEFEDLARYSGLKEIERLSRFHVLNHKAVAKKYAQDINKKYEELNLVVCHMGGGISVAIHHHGKMIDGNNGLDGDGPFSTDRACGLPVGQLVDMCYSGKYSYEEMKKKIKGFGGLMSYLGETDVKKIQQKALEGHDKTSLQALQAMCYQTSKEIAAMATVVEGEIDAILITGGMAHSEFLMNEIKKRVSFIAPVYLYPGEFEMESLGLSVYKELIGEEEIKEL